MDRRATRKPSVPDVLIDALEALLASYWRAEFQDFHGSDLTGPDRQNHIFRQWETVRAWLDYVEEDCDRG